MAPHRGPDVDFAPLQTDKLSLKAVYAAGLTVVSAGPVLANNLLLKARNCIITPHIRRAPRESRQRLTWISQRRICAVRGAPINVVNFGLEAVLEISESFKKQMNHSEMNHGLGVSGEDLIVPIEATGKRQPREGSFHDPSFGQNDELSDITSFDDLQGGGKQGRRPGDQFAGIAAVGKHLLRTC
jgi:hypothetical protein